MTKEEKQLLLKDLCARLPYRTKMLFNNKHNFILSQMNPCQFAGKDGYGVIFDFGGKIYSVEDCKPYLRPMSSMTEEEDKDWQLYKSRIAESCDELLEERVAELHDWFNLNHLDWRGLIPMGLALEAPKGIYKTE